MYAVIKTGGKQYRVQPGDVLDVERLSGDPGSTVTLDENVLMISNEDELLVGEPLLDDAVVEAEIVEHNRSKKGIGRAHV